jgi:hypothetical protein
MRSCVLPSNGTHLSILALDHHLPCCTAPLPSSCSYAWLRLCIALSKRPGTDSYCTPSGVTSYIPFSSIKSISLVARANHRVTWTVNKGFATARRSVPPRTGVCHSDWALAARGYRYSCRAVRHAASYGFEISRSNFPLLGTSITTSHHVEKLASISYRGR